LGDRLEGLAAERWVGYSLGNVAIMTAAVDLRQKKGLMRIDGYVQGLS